jgi:hypothetical protein
VRRNLPIAVALLVLCLLSLWPYTSELAFGPAATDDAWWVSRGAIGNPGWLSWDFATQHFVGYRPVAALTFTLDSLLAGGGLRPWVYRLTDLVLHPLAGLGVYAVFRGIAPTRPRWAALVATAVFLAHPAVDEVVTYMARRSYGLAAAIGLAAVAVLVRGPPRVVSREAIAGSVLLFLALSSNETAYVLLPMIVLFSLHLHGAPGRWRQALEGAALPSAATAIAFVLRLVVLHQVSGYNMAMSPQRTVNVLSIAWESLLVPTTVAHGSDAIGPWELAALAVAVPFYAAVALVLPAVHWRDRDRRLPLLFVAWIMGYASLYVLHGMWFSRLLYAMVPPLAMLVGVVLADTVAAASASPAWWAALVPQALLGSLLLVNAPVLRGPDTARIARRTAQQLALDHMADALLRVDGPALVHVVARVPGFVRSDPYWTGTVRWRSSMPVVWGDAVVRGRPVELHDMGYVAPAQSDGATLAGRVEVAETGPQVRFSEPVHVFGVTRPKRGAAVPDGSVDDVIGLPGADPQGRPEYVYFVPPLLGGMTVVPR